MDQAAEGSLEVVMAAGPSPTEAITRHGMIDVTALHMPTTVARNCRNLWVRASGAKPKLAAADEICVGEAEVRGHGEGIEERSSVTTFQAVHASAMLRCVKSLHEDLFAGTTSGACKHGPRS
jgi:hypothetical protein